MLIVSMNSESEWFHHYAHENAHFGCSTFYINAAQVIPPGNETEVAFWYIPYTSNKICEQRVAVFGAAPNHHRMTNGMTCAGPFKIPRKFLY